MTRHSLHGMTYNLIMARVSLSEGHAVKIGGMDLMNPHFCFEPQMVSTDYGSEVLLILPDIFHLIIFSGRYQMVSVPGSHHAICTLWVPVNSRIHILATSSFDQGKVVSS